MFLMCLFRITKRVAGILACSGTIHRTKVWTVGKSILQKVSKCDSDAPVIAFINMNPPVPKHASSKQIWGPVRGSEKEESLTECK